MKIASSTQQLASSHFAETRLELQESLRVWVGGSPGNNTPPASASLVQISDSGSKAAEASQSASQDDNPVGNDPLLSLIRELVEIMTGRRLKVFDASALHASTAPTPASDEAPVVAENNRPSGFGIAYDQTRTYSEREETGFTANGTVHTSDGQEIKFHIELIMSRSYREESHTRIRLGDAPVTDPLVINFSGTAAQLTPGRFAFDLNADGQPEQVHLAGPGSAFLAVDKNGNGKVDDGSELFGPTTGNGYLELTLLDSDHNGWIDENDPAYNTLQVWTRSNQDEDRLSNLKEVGIGALATAHADTPFAMKDASNRLLARISATGILLHDDGSTGTMQQINLTV